MGKLFQFKKIVNQNLLFLGLQVFFFFFNTFYKVYPCHAVLEINGGLCDKLNIAPGDYVENKSLHTDFSN
jgi:hypothetical protein